MKLLDTVTIACDYTFIEDATALRSVLEAFRIKVDYYRFVQKREVESFFSAPRQADYTVLYCHGDTLDSGSRCINLEVGHQENDDYDATHGWSIRPVQLTPQNIPSLVSNAKGTLLSLACGSGHPELASTFLRAGYDAYIGPTEPYWDSTSALTFAVGFFYNLLSHDRDYDNRKFSDRQSIERAAAIDPEFAQGMRMIRYYAASDL